MKSFVLTTAFVAVTSLSFSQYCSPWPTTNPNTGQSGYVGIGTRASSGPLLTPLPNFNLHLHGTTDYIYDDGITGLIPSTEPIGQEKTITNYGKTTRLGMTNTVTGNLETDGTVLRQSDLNFYMQNRENGFIQFGAGTLDFRLSGVTGRAYLGNPSGPNEGEYGKLNILSVTDNGLHIKTNTAGKYGLSIRSNHVADNAIQVMGTDGTTARFAVKASGLTEIVTTSTNTADKLFVVRQQFGTNKKLLQLTNDGILRSREIIVDGLTWSDYVFAPEYKLMPLSELRSYINTNGHLPNVPSTAEVEAEGVNVAKTDAILLEKIEELTLYLLQQEERMKALEAEIQALKKDGSGN